MESFREQLIILISTPVYAIIIGCEIVLSNLHHRKTYNLRDTLTNLYLLVLNSSIDLLFRGIYVGILVYCYNHQFYSIHQALVYWLLLVLLEDFLYYWLHRFDHEVRLLWAVHVTHHSSEKMNFAVGFRSSVFQPLYRFIYFIPLALLGFKPADILFVYSATQIWGILVHTELIDKMGWLEHIFVTPSHHRVHHASNPKYLDRNMGMFLIIWDKMFGTFQPELHPAAYKPIQYGLTSPLDKTGPLQVVFHEWRSIVSDILQKDLSWKQRFFYLFGAPGWSHDGSRLTSNALRELENEAGEMQENDHADSLQIRETPLGVNGAPGVVNQ